MSAEPEPRDEDATLRALIAPLAPSELRKRRVRAAIAARRSARPRVPVRALALSLLAAGALAAAAMERGWIPGWPRDAPATREAPAPPPAKPHHVGSPASIDRARPPELPPADPVAPPDAPERSPRPIAPPDLPERSPRPIAPPEARPIPLRHPAAPRRRPEAVPIAPVATPLIAPARAADPPEAAPAPRVTGSPDPARSVLARRADALEGTVVIDAVNALRRDHDPARAAMLLDFYLTRFTDGAVAEEALALAVEAAAATDRERAERLARRYLARYPAGRYRQAIRRATGAEGAPR